MITTLAAGKYLALVQDEHWEYVTRTASSGVVVIIGITPQDEVVLVEQYRPPVKRSVIELPAGLVGDLPEHLGESLESAARREFLEETGYEASSLRFLAEWPSSAGLTSETVTVFVADGLVKRHAGGGDETESIRVHTVPVSNIIVWLHDKITRGYHVDPKIYACLYLLRA